MARNGRTRSCGALSCLLALLWPCVPLGQPKAAIPLDADYDARAHAMCVVAPSWASASQSGSVPSWLTPIPRAIHQIWFGPGSSPWQRKMAAWAQYAREHGYTYKLYTDADVPWIAALAPPRLASALHAFLRNGEMRGASDIARYLVLTTSGGIYVDVDMPVPTFRGQSIDVARIMPMTGLALTSDGQAVDLGTGGLHVLNGLMASSPGHPVLQALVAQLADNIECALRGGESSPIIMTGPAPLNVVLSGPITIVPIIYWDAFGVPDDSWR